MTLQILGKPTSINVRKVLWLCAELDVDYTLVHWGSEALPTDNAEFRALNPNSKVPVIRDSDFVLWESNTICRYLAGKHGRSDLLPVAAQARAIVEQWMDWQATELNNSWRYAFMALVRQSAAHTDAKATAASISSWNLHMQILDSQLQRTGAHVAGDEFTLADIAIGLATHRWQMAPIARPRLDAVDAYYLRLSERAAFLLHGRNGLP